MSINDIISIIKMRCAEGQLFPIEPLVSSDEIIRGLYVSAEIKQMLDDHEAQDSAWGTARAIMDDFVSGKLISVGHRKNSRMGILGSINEGVWEIRPSRPSPSIRILGQFAEKDLFIALVWGLRKDLKDKKSIEWKDIIRNCKVEWRKLFSPYPALKGGNENDYVSNIFSG